MTSGIKTFAILIAAIGFASAADARGFHSHVCRSEHQAVKAACTDNSKVGDCKKARKELKACKQANGLSTNNGLSGGSAPATGTSPDQGTTPAAPAAH